MEEWLTNKNDHKGKPTSINNDYNLAKFNKST